MSVTSPEVASDFPCWGHLKCIVHMDLDTVHIEIQNCYYGK